jgi:hypothetical protein
LYRVDVDAVAACNGHCDDVLFALKDGRFARVHLSYAGRELNRPAWPATHIFDAWDQAVAYVEAHADE